MIERLRIKIIPKPVIKGKMDVRFPSRVDALSPILLDKTGGNYTISLDMNVINDSIGNSFQPIDADLTAIAALTTTSYGRSLLTLASATALAAEVDSFFLTPAEGNAAYQPLDSDLTAIAALTTTSYGRAFLALADAAAARTAIALGNVDNTSDANKPVSTATQTALNLKANLASPTFTGTPAAPTASSSDNSTKLATTAYVDAAVTAGGGGVGGAFGFRNRVINPSGQINQAGTGTAADGTYWFDQWVQLNQSNPVTPSQLTNVENGTPFMMRTTQSNASAQRFGILQPIESANCIDLRGQTVTLSARVGCSASTTLRYAIVEWTGTANSVTKDVVNDWTSGTFTTGNFFISTTTTIVATGSTALTANTLATISLSGTVSGSMNNLHVFFWTDSTQTQNVTLDIGKVQLEAAAAATPLAVRSIQEERNLAYRYFYVTGSSGNSIGTWLSTTSAFMVGALPVPMRITSPTASIFGGGSSVSVECFGTGTSTSSSAFPGASQTTWSLNVNTLSPARTANAPAFNQNAFVIDARL